MRILVTGGIGLIGEEVVKQLLALGHQVNILDMWDVSIEGANNFKGSVLDKFAILKAMDECDYVIHLAAVLGVENSTKRPLECLDVNIKGTRNVLECCVMKNIKKILFSSSSEVYGEPNKVPIEESGTLQPKSEYGVSKVVGEEYVKAFSKEFGLNYGIVRFFNIYGPKQTDKFVMPLFIRNVVLGNPLRVYGEGNQVRSFCYVEDAGRGVLEVLFNQKADKDVFNIGNNKTEISMLELARLVIEIAGKSEEPEMVPLEQSDRTKKREIYRRTPDTSKAKERLDFEANIDLRTGIKKVLDYKKANQNAI
jgi:UDP-glucose 4-epimerase